ncbi:ABC transporter ATP-binding protein [Nakamurella flavida]|uniref:ABC transporter ATP-binding protein n=1 Tax=Nakamurella flavida TaxID=363630 RepID=A0A938YM54_9ACTN|nr:ABC transporter ATP-binding protein [Nakamurella flavida]MBM9477744.1 ABC transporter ATP-binding protein [Nakamurella flavida]MDP9779296.1 ABC-type multidrug transport system fused ATPase/permease subunit [Nakamurella flavida]
MAELWPYLRPHRRILLIVAGISIVGAALAVAQPATVSVVIDAVQNGRSMGPVIALLVGLLLGGAIVNGVQQFLLQRTAEAVVLRTRRDLVQRMLSLPIAEYDTRRTGDLVSRVGSDTTLLRTVVTSGLVDAVAGSLVFLGSAIAMALIDPLLLGVTLAVVLLATLMVVFLGRRIQKLTLLAQTQVGLLGAAVARAIPGVRTIRAAGATARETAAVDGIATEAYGTGVRLAKIAALIQPVVGIALQGAFIAVLGLGGYRVATGSMQVSELVAFILYLFMMIMPLGRVFQAYTAIQNALGAVIRIREITALDPESESEPESASTDAGPVPVDPASPALEFRGVSFDYDGVPVLRGVSFRVERGTRTAIVGPSGAGKSTILALIERFYDPAAGTIELDGRDVRRSSRAATRARMGYVEQDSPVLAGTLADNLRLGSPEATDEECVAVLAAVNLTGVLERDPRGLAAQVGEDGILLSGGERQRLAIARSLLAAPDLLLLDEPTASLDSRNEVALREAIDAVAQRRTLVVVAHRLATVADADQIVVLDGGRVRAVGTHDELLGADALYRELAEHQLLV